MKKIYKLLSILALLDPIFAVAAEASATIAELAIATGKVIENTPEVVVVVEEAASAAVVSVPTTSAGMVQRATDKIAGLAVTAKNSVVSGVQAAHAAVKNASATSATTVKTVYADASNRATGFYKDHTRAVQVAAAIAVATVITYAVYKKYFSKSDVEQAPESVPASRSYADEVEEDGDDFVGEEILDVELTLAEQAEVDEIVNATLKAIELLEAEQAQAAQA